MSYVLGIDGGGTKTTAVMADIKGRIIAQIMVGPTNPNVVSEYELLLTFKEIFTNLEQQQPGSTNNIRSIFAGISGAGNKINNKVLVEMIKRLYPGNIYIQVGIDTINALYSGTYGGPGIVQISGTGSIAYGLNSALKTDRVSGWGYLLGDEGSGYDIGRQGVIAALKSDDGRAPKTIILSLLYSYFDVSHPQELIHKIYAASNPRERISPLSKIVFQAYKQKDTQAKRIIHHAAEELTLNISTLYEKLFKTEKQVDVVLCGGIFSEDIVPLILKKRLQNYSNINVILPKIPPVGGSVIEAYKMIDLQPNEDIIKNMITTI